MELSYLLLVLVTTMKQSTFADESNGKNHKTKFTQEAIIKILEIPELEVIVFTTDKAYEKIRYQG